MAEAKDKAAPAAAEKKETLHVKTAQGILRDHETNVLYTDSTPVLVELSPWIQANLDAGILVKVEPQPQA